MNSVCPFAAAITVLSACGAATTATTDIPGPRALNVNMISVVPEADTKVVIEVRNRNWSNATVFMNGRQLGLVSGPNGDELYVLSSADMRDGFVNLKAHFVGGEDFIARTVRLRRGSKILLLLNAMAGSSDVFEQ